MLRVSIRTSQDAKKAITQNGLIYQQALSSDAKDGAQSEEAEMITTQQKIGEKVFTNGGATKFPILQANTHYVILAHTRGYLDEGGDGSRVEGTGRSGLAPWRYWSALCG
jgi:hypothetical protein